MSMTNLQHNYSGELPALSERSFDIRDLLHETETAGDSPKPEFFIEPRDGLGERIDNDQPGRDRPRCRHNPFESISDQHGPQPVPTKMLR